MVSTESMGQEQRQLCHVGQIKGNQHSGKYERMTFFNEKVFFRFHDLGDQLLVNWLLAITHH